MNSVNPDQPASSRSWLIRIHTVGNDQMRQIQYGNGKPGNWTMIDKWKWRVNETQICASFPKAYPSIFIKLD